MYPRRRPPGPPPSDSRELVDRPETEDTDDAVETDLSSCGHADNAGDGVTHAGGDVGRVAEGSTGSAMIMDA